MLVLMIAACATSQPYQTKNGVTSIAFSPDETLLAVANANEIRIRGVETGKPYKILRQLPPNPEGADPRLFRSGVADSMVFLDKDRIASTGMGGLVTIWDIHSGKRLAVIDSLPGDEFASTIDFSPVSNRLVIGTNTGRILMTLIENDFVAPLVPMAELENYILDLQFSRNGNYVASASLRAHTPRQSQFSEETADAFARKVNDPVERKPAEPVPDGNTVQNANILAGSGSNVVIWDAERLESVGILEGANGVLKMELVPGEQALITAGEKVQIWEFLTRKQSGEISDPSMVLQSIGLGALAVASLATLTVGVIPPGDFLANTVLNAGYPFIPSNMFIQHACARTAAISPDGQTIVSTTRGPTLNVMAVIDRKENKVIEKWTADGAVCGLRFTSDGRQMVEASSRGLFVYDTKSWKKSKF